MHPPGTMLCVGKGFDGKHKWITNPPATHWFKDIAKVSPLPFSSPPRGHAHATAGLCRIIPLHPRALSPGGRRGPARPLGADHVPRGQPRPAHPRSRHGSQQDGAAAQRPEGETVAIFASPMRFSHPHFQLTNAVDFSSRPRRMWDIVHAATRDERTSCCPGRPTSRKSRRSRPSWTSSPQAGMTTSS